MNRIPFKQYWDLLSRHIRPQGGRFLLVALLLGSIGLQVINPQIMRQFIDLALGGGALQKLMAAAAAYIGIALLNQVVSVSVAYLGETVAWTATNALRAELAWHCLNLDMGFHNNHTPGELIERIDGDVNEMSTFFSQFVVTLLGNGLLLVRILAALIHEDWRVGLAFVVFTGVALAAMNHVRELALPYAKAFRQADAELTGFLEEQLTGTEDIRSSGAVAFSLRELQRLQAAILRQDRKSQLRVWVINNVTEILLTLALIIAIAGGYLLYQNGTITVGTVFLFINYITMLGQPLWALTHQIESFQKIGACVERLAELRKLEPGVKDGSGTDLSEGALSLSFEGVSFSYESDEPVLRDLSFHLAPGAVLGLLGRTGSGKTTLTRLIFRLYDPTQGRILLGGGAGSPAIKWCDIRDSKLESLRGRVAIVTQEVQLFRASVRDNLTFFDRSLSDAQIEEVIDQLGLRDWFQALPDGLDTLLASGGHSLSAGEAQLLALTRVFLRQPGLVILDEASSRLDPATEQRLEHAIDRLLQGRTAIVIAHRLGTVQRADEIMILDEGQNIEYGPREALANNPRSRFHHLLQTGLEEVLV